MTSRRRLLERILRGYYDLSFRDFTALLEDFSFRLDRTRGSHHIYLHPNIPELLSVQPRKDGKAKPYQVRQFLKLVEAYDLELGEE